MKIIDKEPKHHAPALLYACLLRENQELIDRGLGDSLEAEELADQMDRPWYAMTDAEQKRMRGLSADLYALREGGLKRIGMTAEQAAGWRLAVEEALEKIEGGDVDSLLEFLREPIPAEIPSHVIWFLESMAWDRLGDLETALVFMKAVEKEDPGYALQVSQLLRRLERVDEAVAHEAKFVGRALDPLTAVHGANQPWFDLVHALKG